MSLRTINLFVLSLIMLVGCATPTPTIQKTASFERKTYTVDSCSEWLKNAKPEDMKDKILWEDRLSIEAMRQGDWALAKQTLDDVMLTLGGIHANDPSARKARGLFTAESAKNFIGEPYERCAAYFLRGMIYWKDGELDNARACFRSVEFEDSSAVEDSTTGKNESTGPTQSTKNQKSGTKNSEDSATGPSQYDGDWVLPDYLDGLATAKLGDDGSDAVERAEGHDVHKALPTLDAKANVLVFFEMGRGPIKYSTGQYHEELRFASANAQIVESYPDKQLVSNDPQPSDIPVAKLTVNGQLVTVTPADDLYFQATTRGGRVMDHVLANKAVFKKITSQIGNFYARLEFKSISAATKPTADTRCWDDLPQFFALATLQLPAGKQGATIEFLDPSGAILAQKTINIEVPDGNKDAVVFVSDR